MSMHFYGGLLENMDRARALIPYEVPSRDADIRAIATALDAAEQRGAEREREAICAMADGPTLFVAAIRARSES